MVQFIRQSDGPNAEEIGRSDVEAATQTEAQSGHTSA